MTMNSSTGQRVSGHTSFPFWKYTSYRYSLKSPNSSSLKAARKALSLFCLGERDFEISNYHLASLHHRIDSFDSPTTARTLHACTANSIRPSCSAILPTA